MVRATFTQSITISLSLFLLEPVSIPSASLFLLLFVSIAVVLKAKSVSTALNNFTSSRSHSPLQLSGKPLLPLLCNASILIAFLIAVCLEFPLKLERALIVSLSSCLFLLLQSDGWVVSTKRVSNLFLAPSLVASSLTLFVIAFFRIVDDLSNQMTISELAGFNIYITFILPLSSLLLSFSDASSIHHHTPYLLF